METQKQPSKVRRASRLFREHIGDPQLHKLLDEYDIEKVKNAFNKEESGEMSIEQIQKLLTDITRTIFDPSVFQMVFFKMNARGLANILFVSH